MRPNAKLLRLTRHSYIARHSLSYPLAFFSFKFINTDNGIFNFFFDIKITSPLIITYPTTHSYSFVCIYPNSLAFHHLKTSRHIDSPSIFFPPLQSHLGSLYSLGRSLLLQIFFFKSMCVALLTIGFSTFFPYLWL